MITLQASKKLKQSGPYAAWKQVEDSRTAQCSDIQDLKEAEIMKCNVGQTDRTIRIALGVVILALGLYFGSWWGLVGLVPLVTGIAQWCPLYAPFKISTIRPSLRTKAS